MKNVLKWTNRTLAPFTINIYRGAAELDRKNLSNPIATLTGGESTYSDEVPRGSTNYYVIEVVKGTDKATSNNIQVLALPKKGPGPVTLLQGDYNYGYFGTIASKDFVSGFQLFELAAAGAGIASQIAPIWHKYIRKGKVLYVPQGPILVGGISYKSLYDKGLVFGVNGNGPYQPNGSTPTNQLKTVEVNGSKLKVRLMTGYDDALVGLATNVPNADEYLNPQPNEWDDLVYPLHESTPIAQRMANVAQLTATQLKMYTTNGTYTRQMVQELWNTTGPVFRGRNLAPRGYVASIYPFPGGHDTPAASWWPVLELMED